LHKLVIPTILVSTIIVAGFFAFIPIQQASTVHDQIIAAIEGSLGDIQSDLSGLHAWVTGGHADLSGDHRMITNQLQEHSGDMFDWT